MHQPGYRAAVAALRRALEAMRRLALTKDALARDASGCPVDPLDDKAVSFCVQGALLRVNPTIESEAYRLSMRRLHRAAREGFGATDLFALNDNPGTGQDQLRRLVEAAISMETTDER